MILMIDNYDSFVYNLVQYFSELNEDMVVKRNDELSYYHRDHVVQMKLEFVWML